MTDKMMKAVVKTRPEEGAQMMDVAVPRVEKDWLLCKVIATSICGSDVHIYNWDAWSANRVGAGNLPRILGHEVAGEVVEVGPEVRNIKVGDLISAETHIYDPSDLTAMLGQHHIGQNMQIISLDTQGAFAEYVAVPERVCWKNSPETPPELAAIQEPMGNAMYALLGEDADVAGKTIAIIGDGPIALFACALARAVGLAKIFVTGLSPVSLDIAMQVGADEALLVKPPNGNHVERILDQTNGWGCDIVLDMTGTQPGLDDCFKVLRKGGRLSAFGVSSQDRVTLDYNNGVVFKACQIHGINGRKIFDTWYRVSNLLKSGRVDVYPILTHMLPLTEFAKGFDLARELPRNASKVILFPDEAELARARERATGLLG